MVYQPAALVVRLPFGDAAELVVMEQRFDIAVFRVVDPVRTVVGIGGGTGLTADGFRTGGEVAVGVVGIRDGMAASAVVAVVPEAGQAAQLIVEIHRPISGGGIRNLVQLATLVVGGGGDWRPIPSGVYNSLRDTILALCTY